MTGPGELLVLGLSHRTASLLTREQAALTEAKAREVLHELAGEAAVREAVVLSTCNRTEVYAVAQAAADAEPAIRRVLLAHTAVGASTLACVGYVLTEDEAAEHLFRVAAGLESAVLGESEIAGQVRAAAARSRAEGLLGPLLVATFERALAAAGRVRRRTGIGAGATSLASAVSELVVPWPPPGGGRTLLVGAGRLGQALAGALTGRGGELVVLSRTLASAMSVAERHGAVAAPLDRLEDELRAADAIVCATGAPQAIVTAEMVAAARRARLLIVDLAVPRDVEPGAAAVPGVTLRDLDAVADLVRRNAAGRRSQAEVAGALIRDEVARFATWRREREALPAIRAARRRAEDLRRAELARATAGVGDEERARLEAVTAALVRKLLHEPCERARRACATPDGDRHLESFRLLFGVDDVEAPATPVRLAAVPEAA